MSSFQNPDTTPGLLFYASTFQVFAYKTSRPCSYFTSAYGPLIVHVIKIACDDQNRQCVEEDVC
ncbi:MAG: hypothetical protein JWQ96_3305 [Segetibacter sp.]|nr:hypothetical protein [Segetibacter sp.]